jgi:hypothetical protein
MRELERRGIIKVEPFSHPDGSLGHSKVTLLVGEMSAPPPDIKMSAPTDTNMSAPPDNTVSAHKSTLEIQERKEVRVPNTAPDPQPLEATSSSPPARSKKSKAASASKPETPPPARFAEFWAAYPRRVGKLDAEAAYARVIAAGAATEDELIAAAARYATFRAAEIATGDDPKFTKHAATWLNKACWTDEYEMPKPRPVRRKGSGYMDSVLEGALSAVQDAKVRGTLQ